MTDTPYKAAIVGLGYIGGADQVSGDALGQLVEDLDGTHIEALAKHPKVEVVAGSSRDLGRRERFTERTGIPTYADWREMIRTGKSGHRRRRHLHPGARGDHRRLRPAGDPRHPLRKAHLTYGGGRRTHGHRL